MCLFRLRKDLKHVCKERGLKLSFMPFFLKAASLALLKYPIINSSLDLENMSIIYKVRNLSRLEIYRHVFVVFTASTWVHFFVTWSVFISCCFKNL